MDMKIPSYVKKESADSFFMENQLSMVRKKRNKLRKPFHAVIENFTLQIKPFHEGCLTSRLSQGESRSYFERESDQSEPMASRTSLTILGWRTFPE